uniref:N-myc downstream regulated n=1 Tax=Timema tahoe TaxID=61484 RepID=A0A7R9IBP5_9NEOP|nr:unnamed protein product [Timema tahoe]
MEHCDRLYELSLLASGYFDMKPTTERYQQLYRITFIDQHSFTEPRFGASSSTTNESYLLITRSPVWPPSRLRARSHACQSGRRTLTNQRNFRADSIPSHRCQADLLWFAGGRGGWESNTSDFPLSLCLNAGCETNASVASSIRNKGERICRCDLKTLCRWSPSVATFVSFRGSEPAFAWRKSGKPFRKNHPSSPNRDSNLDLPVLGSLAQHKTGALANQATEGDLNQQTKRAVFLTVHDLGCNHTSFHDFVNHPSMYEIKERSVFIHVDIPGHEDNALALPDTFPFPTMQQLGEELLTVVDFLHVKYVIGLGEGAGANVLARFGLAHPSRVLGLILINCTGSAASVMDTFKSKFVNWRGKQSMSQSAEDYLIFHKFGHQLVNSVNPDREKVLAEFQARLRCTLNPKNLKLYVNAFLNRKDLSLKQCKVDVLLITGLLSPYASVVEKLNRDLEKNKVTLLKIEKAGDVLMQAPHKVAQSILLFCKGQGILTSLVMPGVDRQRTFSGSSDGSGDGSRPRRMSRGMSMEEYDKPNIRRLSLTVVNPDQLPNKHN